MGVLDELSFGRPSLQQNKATSTARVVKMSKVSANDSITSLMVSSARLDGLRVQEITEEYGAQLGMLKDNNKPKINFLTMLAEESASEGYGVVVIRVIDTHIFEVAPYTRRKCVKFSDNPKSIILLPRPESHYWSFSTSGLLLLEQICWLMTVNDRVVA